MKYTKNLLIAATMIFVTGCVTSPGVTVRVIGECSWTRYITPTEQEIEDLLNCCRPIAEQIDAHNTLREENCQ